MRNRAYPKCIKPYANFLHQVVCKVLYDNYNVEFQTTDISLDFGWSEISKFISEKDFIECPIEEIKIRVVIRNTDDEKYSHKAAFRQGKESYKIKSISNLVEESYHYYFVLIMDIPNNNKYTLNKIYNLLNLTFDHELTHAYHNIKTGNIPNESLVKAAMYMMTMKLPKSMLNLFWSVYFSHKYEMLAYMSGLNVSSYTVIKNNLERALKDDFCENIRKDLTDKFGAEKSKGAESTMIKIFKKEYLECTKIFHEKIDENMLDTRTLEEFVGYLIDTRIRPAKKYFFKKADKLINDMKNDKISEIIGLIRY